MTKKNRALISAGQETGAENGVGILVQKHFNHFQHVGWVILKVGIVNHHQIRIDMRQPGTDARTFPGVLFVVQEQP